MIRFSVARLEKEPIELVGSEPAEFLEIESSDLLTVCAPVAYDLVVKSVSGGALVEGKISTRLSSRSRRRSAPTTSASFLKSAMRRRWIFPKMSVPRCCSLCR